MSVWVTRDLSNSLKTQLKLATVWATLQDRQSVPLESCCVKWKMPLCWPLLWTRLDINVLERSEWTHVSILGQSRNICHLWFFSFNASNFHLSVIVADNKPNESYILHNSLYSYAFLVDRAYGKKGRVRAVTTACSPAILIWHRVGALADLIHGCWHASLMLAEAETFSLKTNIYISVGQQGWLIYVIVNQLLLRDRF